MPELPEVETVRRGLEPHLVGARLARVVQNRADLRFPLPERFAERMEGVRVAALRRRAKYLLAELDSGETLVAHLGMSGRFTVDANAQGWFHYDPGGGDKHTHLVFVTDRGAVIGFNDARRFGYMALIATKALEDHPWFKALGPEPLGNGFSAPVLATALAARRQSIKATLLDQRVVAGLGNIYVCEALFCAGIDPRRPAGSLKPAEIDRLVAAIKAVLEAAIAAGGSTLRDYRNAEGELGYFQHRFQVYGREGEPCAAQSAHGARRKGTIERIVQAGRSTFFCPACQR